LLSPANKAYPGRTEYLAKRMALLHQDVHLAELDLLLGGHRLPMQRPIPPADYYYFVARGQHRPDCQVFSWALRQPLPSIPVPLRDPDPDVVIHLGPVFAAAYDRGRFRRRINYRVPPPVLRDEDKEWAEAIVKAVVGKSDAN
jgi:hypothetical protein